MRDIFDGNVPEKDERIHIPGTGAGRDIGRRQDYDPRVPMTREQARRENQAFTVGGFGERNDKVTSLAATAIEFGGAEGYLYSGAGSLKAIQFRTSYHDTHGTIAFDIRNGGAQGALLFRGMVTPINLATSVSQFSWGDFGVNFDSLYVSNYILSSGLPVDLTQVTIGGTVYVASVE